MKNLFFDILSKPSRILQWLLPLERILKMFSICWQALQSMYLGKQENILKKFKKNHLDIRNSLYLSPWHCICSLMLSKSKPKWYWCRDHIIDWIVYLGYDHDKLIYPLSAFNFPLLHYQYLHLLFLKLVPKKDKECRRFSTP